MLPWMLIALAAAGAGAISLGFLPPPWCATLIRIRDGAVRCTRGRLQSHALLHITDTLEEAGIARGFIAISSGHRIRCSRSIPPRLHQRIRNILLNQWA